MTAPNAFPPANSPAEGEQPVLRPYEMWVRTVLSPALAASLPLQCEPIRISRPGIRRLRVDGARELPAVFRLLAEAGIEVVDVRVVERCA